MKIKTKLTLNILILIIIIAVLCVASIVGMAFVKTKIHYLTQRSTPFQMRTVEFQRAMQGATADLIKVSASRSLEDSRKNRADAEKSLAEVQAAQEALASLSGATKSEAYNDLKAISAELITITEERLKAEEAARQASDAISGKLTTSSAKLKELDAKIKNLQAQTSASYVKSSDTTQKVSDKMRNMESLLMMMKDAQVAFFELQRAQIKQDLAGVQSKSGAVLATAKQNEYLKSVRFLTNDLNSITSKTDELAKMQSAFLEQGPAATNGRDALISDISKKMNNFIKSADQALASVRDQHKTKSDWQNSIFSNSNIATAILNSNSELIALGLTVEGLSSKLFIVSTDKGVDDIEQEIGKVYTKIGTSVKSLEKALIKLGAKQELGILHNAVGSLNAIREMISAKDGIPVKIRNQIAMQTKAAQATDTLASSSEELSATAVTLERGSDNQNSRIDQTASAMTEMAQTTTDVARNTNDTSEAANKMKLVAENGKGAMLRTMHELSQFAETVKKAAEKVESLGQHSDQINDVVTLIRDIADQANLLALNAEGCS